LLVHAAATLANEYLRLSKLLLQSE
jgi:hypothetical protein